MAMLPECLRRAIGSSLNACRAVGRFCIRKKKGSANPSQSRAVTQTPRAISGLKLTSENENASPAIGRVAQGSGDVKSKPGMDADEPGEKPSARFAAVRQNATGSGRNLLQALMANEKAQRLLG